MIREFTMDDLERVMAIWLDTNIQAHDFIANEYWIRNFDMVKNILPEAELYVYEIHNEIGGFVGINSGYIQGIFIAEKMQSNGIGKLLLEKCKQHYGSLRLNVYEKNSRAVEFYLREGFTVDKKQIDEDTKEIEYLMTWTR
ncbi:MAG: N-acetyltransferase [Cellulosilyticaceae bacterium]